MWGNKDLKIIFQVNLMRMIECVEVQGRCCECVRYLIQPPMFGPTFMT